MHVTELNYNIYNKKMLAIILTLEKWRWLQGLQTKELFQLYSDY
jgi:hypothetical protein